MFGKYQYTYMNKYDNETYFKSKIYKFIFYGRKLQMILINYSDCPW